MKLYRFTSLLWFGLVCSAESKELHGVIGGNVTIPDVVEVFGILKHHGVTVMLVEESKIEFVLNKSRDQDMNDTKYQWSNTTGWFTITDLEKTDAGNLTITFSNRTVTYQLTVHDPPAVQTLSVSSDSCYLLCAVDKAAEITLWWYKDQEVVNQSSSAGSLPLTVTKQDLSSSYRCVAGNPAENKTVVVDLQEVCGENFTSSSSENNHRHVWIIIGVSAALLVLLPALSITWTCSEEPEVKYDEVKTSSVSQNQGGNSPHSSGSADNLLEQSDDKLEADNSLQPFKTQRHISKY